MSWPPFWTYNESNQKNLTPLLDPYLCEEIRTCLRKLYASAAVTWSLMRRFCDVLSFLANARKLNTILTKAHPDPIWNDGNLGLFWRCDVVQSHQPHGRKTLAQETTLWWASRRQEVCWWSKETVQRHVEGSTQQLPDMIQTPGRMQLLIVLNGTAYRRGSCWVWKNSLDQSRKQEENA